jgi:hypothetical protein
MILRTMVHKTVELLQKVSERGVNKKVHLHFWIWIFMQQLAESSLHPLREVFIKRT